MRVAPKTLIESLNAVEYVWNFQTDTLHWNGAVERIFEDNTENLKTGQSFLNMLSAESRTLFEAIKTHNINSAASTEFSNVNFTHLYCIYPDKNTNNGRVWVENFGKIIVNENNVPIKALGIMRVTFGKQNSNMNGAQVHTIQNEISGNLGRRMFRELLAESFEDSKITKKPLCVCVSTLSNLNDINENYGFDAADELIEKVIICLRRYLRKRDYIGQISGGKFALVLHNCTDKAAQIAFLRFSNAISSAVFEIEGNSLKTSILFGVVVVPHGVTNGQEALSKAKEALIDAKLPINKGFNCYSASMERHFNAQKLKDASEAILSALNERRIELAFQPVMNAQGEGVWFYEALVRLRMVDGRLLSAGAFVPIAEKLGLMKLIDHRVLELALQALEQNPEITLSINITPDTTHSDEWLNTLKAAQRKTPHLMKQLIIELTESAVVDNLDWCRSFLIEIKVLGCLAAIDDFGAGYTSFRYLRAFNVDIVKIDGGYIMNLASSEDDQAFVKTLLTLCKSLDLKVVAEWVVTSADAKLLRSWGVDGLQGEFATMPVSNLAELIGAIEQPRIQKTQLA